MSTAPRTHATEAEYLAWDLEHEGKHEYIGGEIVAMAGAGPRHDRVVSNLHVAVGSRVRGGPCEVSTSDQRVHLDDTGLYAYPDLTVTCGRPEFATARPLTLLNPTVLFEVHSPTTIANDLAKAAHYRHRPSVAAYVLVSIPDRRVELYERQGDDRWLLSTYSGDGALPLRTAGIEVPLAEIWRGVDDLPEDDG